MSRRSGLADHDRAPGVRQPHDLLGLARHELRDRAPAARVRLRAVVVVDEEIAAARQPGLEELEPGERGVEDVEVEERQREALAFEPPGGLGKAALAGS